MVEGNLPELAQGHIVILLRPWFLPVSLLPLHKEVQCASKIPSRTYHYWYSDSSLHITGFGLQEYLCFAKEISTTLFRLSALHLVLLKKHYKQPFWVFGMVLFACLHLFSVPVPQENSTNLKASFPWTSLNSLSIVLSIFYLVCSFTLFLAAWGNCIANLLIGFSVSPAGVNRI